MKQPFPFFGLALDDLFARFVVLERTKSNYSVGAMFEEALPHDTITGGRIPDVDRFGKTLKDIVKNPHRKRMPKHAIVSLPDTHCFLMTMHLPEHTGAELPEAVRWEAGQYLPFAIDEVYLDWEIITKENGLLTIQVTATEKTTADQYVKALDAAGITPLALIPNSAALLFSLEPKRLHDGAILIHFSATTTTLALLDDGGIHATVTSPVFSDQSLTSILVQKLKLSHEDAEKAKVVCGLDPSVSQGVVRDALVGEIKQLVAEIQRLQAYATRREGGKPCDTLFLTGPGAQLRSLDQELQKRTKMVLSTNPLRHDIFHLEKNKPLTDHERSAFAPALGLVLFGLV